MKRSLNLIACLILIMFNGCSGVKVYSDAAMQNKTAIQFHYAKPYLLVEHNINKDGATKNSIIYLPDLTETFYAHPIIGIGNSDLKLSFENGSIASFGTSSDNKILLSTGSLSGLVSDLSKVPNPSLTDKKPGLNESGFELYAIVSSEGKIVLKKIELKN